MIYKKYFKRVLDIGLSLCALPFVTLVGMVVCPMIYFEDKGNVFYLGPRRGKNGKIFKMIKFRSMKVNSPDLRNTDNSTFNSKKDPRVTKIGKIIRKTSIDELPQIINVLKGDMSLIGPRASVPISGITYQDLNDLQKKKLEVRPGITGYSASKFRNSISKDQKKELEAYYVDNVSFILDMKIIWWTLKSVILRKNIYTN